MKGPFFYPLLKISWHQITLLEGRDKCDIKLTRPIKFFYGRRDCVPAAEAELPYIAPKTDEQPSPYGTGDEALIFMKNNFNMTIRHSAALMAVHRHGNCKTWGCCKKII